MTDLIQLTLNTIRGLTMDAVQAANSGHPGMPMGAAALGYTLFARHLRYDPEAPEWFNRDRFVLSAGHGCMLLYSLLYLTGFEVTLDDIKRFRQWHSKTPGHPERGLTPGVELTTGPLGQGFGNGVGFAIAEAHLRAEFPGLVDHWTYVICSDGDLMEGVSSEVGSLAGHMKLGRLIYLYDSNRVSIDGSTDLTFTEDVKGRFESFGWHVLECDGMDVQAVDEAVTEAKLQEDRPSLIICHTTIGYGSPNKAGSCEAHGAPLGEEEVRLAKRELGIPEEPAFYVPEEVLKHMREVGLRHRAERLSWEEKLQECPELQRRLRGELPLGWSDNLPTFDEPMATRAGSGKVLAVLSQRIPELMGGSADLMESTFAAIPEGGNFSAENPAGRTIHFGVREHAMATILNGMNVHGGVRAYGSTFLIFSDYMRPAIRLASLMKAPTIFIFTHDSIGLGEDGPTHQPIEQLPSLRAIPGLRVIRPADANETATAWKAALSYREGPTALILTRQKVPIVTPPGDSLLKGAYVLVDSEKPLEVILIGTGSEVSICVSAREILEAQGVGTRVVSMPCWELFEEQPEEYREQVLPSHVWNRVSVEAGSPLGWERWVGARGTIIGMRSFGASAPSSELFKRFGFTPEKVAEHALRAREQSGK